MEGHALHAAEVLLARVHNPSDRAVLVHPVIVATSVGGVGGPMGGDGANIAAMDRAILVEQTGAPTVLAGGQSECIYEEAPFKCRPRILRIDTDSQFDILVNDLKIGNRSQLVDNLPVPVELFKGQGFDLGPYVALAEPFQDIGLYFTNLHKFDARRILKIELDVEVYDRLDAAPPELPHHGTTT
jgi:hypothetical protein